MVRRMVHVGLAFTAIVCLMLSASLPFKQATPSSQTVSSSASQATEIIAATTSDAQLEATDTPLSLADSVKNIRKPSVSDIITKGIKFSAPEKEKERVQVVKVRNGDTLAKIFTRVGLPTQEIREILRARPSNQYLTALKAGQTLKLRMTNAQQIAHLTLDIAPGSILNVQRSKTGFQAEHKLLPFEKQLAFGKGAIRNSLFSSVKKAGLDQNILNQIVDIFGFNIDFALDLQPNDTFRVLYEEKYWNGKRIQTGNIVAAEIINDGIKHQAIRYTDKSGRTGYFSPDGYGLHQAFLRTPVNFTRISSHFDARRKHPVFHKIREHKGIDYSAPHGTPVQSTGDGKVVFVGTKGGYGNVVELQHGARYKTLYAHLSRFSKDLKVNSSVRQGQVIGYVGRTGLATGDHLHYEFHIDGVHHNPLTVPLPKKNPIPKTHKPHFIAHAQEMLRLLDNHERKTVRRPKQTNKPNRLAALSANHAGLKRAVPESR